MRGDLAALGLAILVAVIVVHFAPMPSSTVDRLWAVVFAASVGGLVGFIVARIERYLRRRR